MLSHDVDLAEVEAALVSWLRRKMPQAEAVSVSNLERSGAGFTNVSIAFTLAWQEAGQHQAARLVFRGAGKSDPVYPDCKLEKQFRVMRALQDTNVPVPKVYWIEKDASLLGFPFYVMSKVDGLVPSEYPPYHSFGLCYDATPGQRAKMWWGTLAALADIHRLDWRRLGLSFLGVPPDGTGPLDQELAYWEHYLNWAKEEEQPILEAGLDWLQRNRYVPERVTLCWGDARLPNTMFNASGDVVAVLDWDMAVLGDPEWDVAFLVVLDWLLSEGTGVPRLDGFPDTAATLARYEQLTGWRVSNFVYNEIFATFRAGVVILRVQKNLQKMGVALPGDDPILDNLCTRRLATLLSLPPPGTSHTDIRRREDLSGTVQVHLTGPNGGEWYIVALKGRVTRYAGSAATADATMTISATDWSAIQRGETNPFNAWTSGKLQVTGNSALFQQLADAIAKMWSQPISDKEEGQ